MLPSTDIQGDSGGICTSLGNDSMSDSKQNSSYEHGSDFERLRSYDRLNLGIEGNDYPLSYRVPVRERYGSTLLPATREQHDQNCTVCAFHYSSENAFHIFNQQIYFII